MGWHYPVLTVLACSSDCHSGDVSGTLKNAGQLYSPIFVKMDQKSCFHCCEVEEVGLLNSHIFTQLLETVAVTVEVMMDSDQYHGIK